ncbi:hypothetical protein HQ50_00440 [Porphyromonas sp. COT-052 OH4946]|nr:hypothetical protein HQ50_00440 [Porphyromonas sp. COT-052 OH4946]
MKLFFMNVGYAFRSSFSNGETPNNDFHLRGYKAFSRDLSVRRKEQDFRIIVSDCSRDILWLSVCTDR